MRWVKEPVVGLEAGLGDQRGRDGRIARGRQDGGGWRAHAPTAAASDSTTLAKTPMPSVEPRRGSIARSGWGIITSTFPSALRIPAMLRSDQLGLPSGVAFPCA